MARARRLAIIAAVAAAAIAVIAVLGVRAATAITNRKSAGASARVSESAAAQPRRRPDTVTSPPAVVPAPPAIESPPRGERLAPVISSAGTTDLGDGVFAMRAGDTVIVRFDNVMVRTRRADKFEQHLRTSLGAVFGAVADSAMHTIPEGIVARSGDLLGNLATLGVRVPVAAGDTLVIWPTVRRGRDGLLVFGYRAVVAKK